MLILRQRSFGRKEQIGKFLKESPVMPATALGLSATSVYLSATRNRQLKDQNQKQLKALENLTKSLNKVDKTISSTSNEVLGEVVNNKKSKYSIFK